MAGHTPDGITSFIWQVFNIENERSATKSCMKQPKLTNSIAFALIISVARKSKSEYLIR